MSPSTLIDPLKDPIKDFHFAETDYPERYNTHLSRKINTPFSETLPDHGKVKAILSIASPNK